MSEKSLEQTATFANMVAKKQGWVLNHDADFVETLLQGLTVNFNRYGYYLCPCRDSEGNREADAEVICPCVHARPDIAEYGHCFCALYMSEQFSRSGKPAGGIPDRRVS